MHSLKNGRTHIDLFSGIGGFALAAKACGLETILFCEKEPFAQQILNKHWPHVPIVDDIFKLRFNKARQDDFEPFLLTGGFPCQPFSQAGKRKGAEDDRYLWPEMVRVIKEFQPTWVIGENVAGILSMDNGDLIDQILADLEGIGYECQTFIIPACGVGAMHRRDRIWIVGHAEHDGQSPSTLGRSTKETVRDNAQGAHETRKPERADSSRKLPDNVVNSTGDRRNEVGYETRNAYGQSEDANGRDRATERSAGRQRPQLANGNVGNADSGGQQGSRTHGKTIDQKATGNRETDWANGTSETAQDERCAQSRLGRDTYGLPDWLDRPEWPLPIGNLQHEWEPPRVTTRKDDRANRLKGLGNAIVPQVAYQIIKGICQTSDT